MATKWVFNDDSGFECRINKLKEIVYSIEDDNFNNLVENGNFFNWTTTKARIDSAKNYPIFVVSGSSEKRGERRGQSSKIQLSCWFIANIKDAENGDKIFNRMLARITKIFTEDYEELFNISSINRSGEPQQLKSGLSKNGVYYSANLLIDITSITY